MIIQRCLKSLANIKTYPRVVDLLARSSSIHHSASNSSSNIHPTRCTLYVPASDPKKISKIFASNADCVVLDCEDGVALNRKQEARENIRKLYETDTRVQNDVDARFAVRINAPLTDFAKSDIESMFGHTKHLPRCVFVPKTSSADDIKWLFESFDKTLKSDSSGSAIRFFFYMETALGLINLNSIILTALELSASKYNSRFKLDGFVFGSDDYCADIGAQRTKDAAELIYARQKVVAFCKAYKLKPIDMVYIDFKDLEGLRVQSEQGARMGFSGKQVIHPSQVDVVQQAFTPSQEKIEWAMGLIEAFKKHQQTGAGAFTYRGQMIDMPSLLQAENIMAIVNRVNQKKPE